jgi:hypothetical protein
MTTTLDTREPRTARGAALTTAIAGPLFLLLAFAMPADGPPVATATAAQIRAYALEQATALRIGTLAGVASVVVVLVLTAAFAQVVRAALPDSMLADLGAGAGYLLAGALLLTITAAAVPTLLPGLIGTELSGVDDAVLRGWYGINGFLHLLGDLQMGLIAVVGRHVRARRGARPVPAPVAGVAGRGDRRRGRPRHRRCHARLGAAVRLLVRRPVRLGPVVPGRGHRFGPPRAPPLPLR